MKHFVTSLLVICGMGVAFAQSTGNAYRTTPTQVISQLFYPNRPMTSNSNMDVELDASTTYQNIDGFGLTFTQGSAEVMSSLNATALDDILEELFDPINGIGISVVRISIGASDMSNGTYTYNDNGPDPDLSEFSLAGPDGTYLIPMLKKVVAINPDIKFLATPWTAPPWMKDNNGWIGGDLKWENHSVYADYFVKYIQAMAAEGIDIWAITPQNEPLNPWNEPSMYMGWNQQVSLINEHLGPKFDAAGIDTKIIGYDHNPDELIYPVKVAAESDYVLGTAFHFYGGDMSGLSTVHNTTNKPVFFTEQWTKAGDDPWWDFKWHQENVFFSALDNMASTVLEWNLATDEWHGPRTSGGCDDCLGAITVKSNGEIHREVQMYNIAPFSKLVRPGAVRVKVNSSVDGLRTAGFVNADGSRVIVAYNPIGKGNRNLSFGEGGEAFVVPCAENTTVSVTWGGEPVEVDPDPDLDPDTGGGGTGVTTLTDGEYYIVNRNSGLYLEATSNMNGAKMIQSTFDGDDLQKFNIVKEADGKFKIENVSSGKVLDVEGVSMDDGGIIQQWDDFGSDNQRFDIQAAGDPGFFYMESLHADKAIEVKDGSATAGADIQQWSYFQADWAQWEFVSTLSTNSTYEFDAPSNWFFPNPLKSGGVMNVGGHIDGLTYDMQITDVTGKELAFVQGMEVRTLGVNLSPGTYLVRLRSGGQAWSRPQRIMVVE